MKPPHRALAALFFCAAAALLGGCSSEGRNAEAPTVIEFARLAGAAVRNTPAPQGAAPLLSRAEIEAYPVPLDLVLLEKTDATALVYLVGRNGGVETWSSADGKTLALRQGVLLATRGLGPDLMGSGAPSLARLASAGGGAHERIVVTLGGEDQTIRSRFSCTLAAQGGAQITIVLRSYAVRRVKESCTGDSGAFVNDFWFQGSTLRQSRQWAGPGVGHITVQRLRG